MPKQSKPRKKARVAGSAPPKFANEAEERAFWESSDTVDYVDWSRAERVRLPNLKPSTATTG